MHTLGYRFKPWRGQQAMADGPSILHYIQEAAQETGVAQHIAYGHHVVSARWSSADACWTITAQLSSGEQVQQRAKFLYLCGGYYSYAQGHQPHFEGQAQFKGDLVHPQFWPEGLSHAGKRVVVIGSGATAITLVPAMAQTAKHVTMLQRSPSYVVSRPGRDAVALWLDRCLPSSVAYSITRWKNILQGLVYFQLARRWPVFFKGYLVKMLNQALRGQVDVKRHFTPRYKPWDQRVCAVPDGDLFRQINRGQVSVVTDTISHFTPDGVALHSGEVLSADIVVIATGLQLNVLADIAFEVDGNAVVAGDTYAYKGMMLSGLPNMAMAFGYTNASWTLKADLTSGFVCRLLKHMDAQGFRWVCPQADGPLKPEPFLDFTSGYVVRATDRLPKQGPTSPWRVHQNYLMDLLALRFGRLHDGVLRFSR
jgi:cyclohexanone monooxygenase